MLFLFNQKKWFINKTWRILRKGKINVIETTIFNEKEAHLVEMKTCDCFDLS